MSTQALHHEAVHATEHEHHDDSGNTLFGFWIYLMSDCVLFATLFATFIVLRHNYADAATGKELFHLPYVLVETMFLLFSSLTYGLAMLALYKGKKSQVMAWLGATFLLGLGFFIMEIHEFRQMIGEGFGPNRSGFLSAFYTLVGTHGAHVFVGLIWMAVMMLQIQLKGLNNVIKLRLSCLSLFWHFLDIVWIGVFTLVYLMGVM